MSFPTQTNVYGNVTNVIARVSWNQEPESLKLPSLLINAHFDTAPGSPGASDDGVGIALMIELCRVLAEGPALNRPVTLLFNGAEESNQQGNAQDTFMILA